MTFYQIVTLASIVEHEAAVDKERPLIAGVYQNRLDGLHGVARILNADPTVTYAIDTMALEDLPFEEWQNYASGTSRPGRWPTSQVDASLQGYPDLPGRAGSSRARSRRRACASIEAALEPEPAKGYLYFVLDPGRPQDARLREDARGARGEPAQVRLHRVTWRPDR